MFKNYLCKRVGGSVGVGEGQDYFLSQEIIQGRQILPSIVGGNGKIKGFSFPPSDLSQEIIQGRQILPSIVGGNGKIKGFSFPPSISACIIYFKFRTIAIVYDHRQYYIHNTWTDNNIYSRDKITFSDLVKMWMYIYIIGLVVGYGCDRGMGVGGGWNSSEAFELQTIIISHRFRLLLTSFSVDPFSWSWEVTMETCTFRFWIEVDSGLAVLVIIAVGAADSSKKPENITNGNPNNLYLSMQMRPY